MGRAVQENLALPLDEYLGALPGDFYPGLLEAGRFQGRTYALPVELHLPVLFFNADQLASRRLNPPKAGRPWPWRPSSSPPARPRVLSW